MIDQIKNNTVNFSALIEFIDQNYTFEPVAFTNGDIVNEVNQNNGSNKVFQFALTNKLSKEETLACFGDFYKIDVLQHPDAENHQNIRNFMKYGFEGIAFTKTTLQKK